MWKATSNGGTTEVDDVRDPTHPVKLGTVPANAYGVHVVNADAIGYSVNSDIYRAPALGGPPVLVTTGCLGVFDFAWNSDATQLAYLSDSADGSNMQLHIVRGGVDRIVDDSMAPIPAAGECEGLPCMDNVALNLMYSPSGSFISLVQAWSSSELRVWSSTGSLITKIDYPSNPRDPAGPDWSVWSGETLYYRDSRGVEAWVDGTSSLVLPGVIWMAPSASPAGGHIAYQTRDAAGVPHIFDLDTTTNKVRELSKLRASPAFLTARYLWYVGQQACTESSWPQCLTTQGYLYDLQGGVESKSSISQTIDVWPRAA